MQGVVATAIAGAAKTATVIRQAAVDPGTEYEEFKINYATNGLTQYDTRAVSCVNIDRAAGGDLTVNFSRLHYTH